MLKRDLADNCAIVARLQFCSMQPPDLMQWVRYLRAVAEPVTRSGSPQELGPIDAMLEAAVRGTQVDTKPGPHDGPEVRLWAALVDPRIDPPEIDADESARCLLKVCTGDRSVDRDRALWLARALESCPASPYGRQLQPRRSAA